MNGIVSVGQHEVYSKYRAKKEFGPECNRLNGFRIYSSGDKRFSVFKPADGKGLELIASTHLGRPKDYINMIGLLNELKNCYN